MKTAFSSFIYSRKGIYGILHVLILCLSLFLIISISMDTFHNIPFINQGSYLRIQFWICMFFLFDFLLEFFLAPDKWRYLSSHFVYHITFSPEVSYFLRFIPLLRGGYALAIVVGWLSGSKASGLFTSYITMLMATVYFASLIFFVLEHKVNPMVTDYWSALWWAFMDVTTVGSNIYAVTPTGKILSVVLAALGMMMFPIFTVYVTSLVQQANKRKQEYYEKQNANADTSRHNVSADK